VADDSKSKTTALATRTTVRVNCLEDGESCACGNDRLFYKLSETVKGIVVGCGRCPKFHFIPHSKWGSLQYLYKKWLR
jgi:hypothetical protein